MLKNFTNGCWTSVFPLQKTYNAKQAVKSMHSTSINSSFQSSCLILE